MSDAESRQSIYDMMNARGSMLPGSAASNGVPNQGQARGSVQGSGGQLGGQASVQQLLAEQQMMLQHQQQEQQQQLRQQQQHQELQQQHAPGFLVQRFSSECQEMSPQQIHNHNNRVQQQLHQVHQPAQGPGLDPLQIRQQVQQQIMNRAVQQNNSGISGSVPTMTNANYGMPPYINGQTGPAMQQNLLYGPRTSVNSGMQNVGTHNVFSLNHGGNALPMAPAVPQCSSPAMHTTAGHSVGTGALPAPPQNCEYVFDCGYCGELIPTVTPSVVTSTDVMAHLSGNDFCYENNMTTMTERWRLEKFKEGPDPIANGQVMKPQLSCLICKRAGKTDNLKFANASVANNHMDKHHRNTAPVTQASPVVAVSPPPVYPSQLDHGAAMAMAQTHFYQQPGMRATTPANSEIDFGNVFAAGIQHGLENRASVFSNPRSIPMHRGGVSNSASPQTVQPVPQQNQSQQNCQSQLAALMQQRSPAAQRSPRISSSNRDSLPQNHAPVGSHMASLPVQNAAGPAPSAILADGVGMMAETLNDQRRASLDLRENAVAEQPVRESQPQPVPEAPVNIPLALLQSEEDSEMPTAERSAPDSSTSPRFETGTVGISDSSSTEAEAGEHGQSGLRKTGKRKQRNPAKRTERAASVVIIEQPQAAAPRDDMDDLSCDSDGNPADQEGSADKLSPKKPRIKKEPVPVPAAQHFDEQIHSSVDTVMEPTLAEAVAEQTVDHPMVAQRSPSMDSAKENAQRAAVQSVSTVQAAAGRPPLRETGKNASRQKIITRRWICKCGDLTDSRDEYKRHFAKHVRGAARSRSASKWLCPREQCNYQADDEEDFSGHIARHILLQHMYRVQIAKREEARQRADPSPAKAV